MPTYIFTCNAGHSQEVYRRKPYKASVRKRCVTCGLYSRRDYVKEHSSGNKTIHLDYENDPISHLVQKRSFKGITIENLTPEPVRVTNETQYLKLLKDTHSREKRV